MKVNIPTSEATDILIGDLERTRAEIQRLGDKFKANGQKWTSDAERQKWARLNVEYDSIADKLQVSLRDDEYAHYVNIAFPNASVDADGVVRIGGRAIGGERITSPREEVVDMRTGKKQPVLRGNDSMAAAMLKEDPDLGNGYRGLELGSYLRAMVLGPKTSAEKNALGEGSDSTGGYTVPPILAAQLIDLFRSLNQVTAAGAATIRMEGPEVSYAKLTNEPTPVWRREHAEVTEGSLTFGRVTFHARSLAVLVKASRELLEDSGNINAVLPMVLARAMASEVDRVALFGEGSEAEPLGVFNMSDVNVVSMGQNGNSIVDYSDLLDAQLAIENANAPTPTAAIMAPRTAREYAGLVDLQGQPLRRPEALANLRFLSTTKVPVDQTQGSATNASSIIVGGFSELVLAIRNNLRIEVLRERYAENMQYGFIAHLRMDVGAWHEQAFAKIVGIVPEAS